jgi:sigma-E factor negative regulatory protein RseB
MRGPVSLDRYRLLPAALALGAACGAAAAPPGNDPVEWLQRAAQAARSASYSGTYAHSNGDRASTIRITHIAVGNDEQERIEPLDGPPHEIVRHNEDMLCYFPDAKTVRLDRRVSARFFPAIFSAPAAAVAASYVPSLGNIESVLGFDCQWIRLEPKDALRYSQSVCAEMNTGLIIRSKTFNAQHQVIEQYTFTDLRIGQAVVPRNEVKSTFEARVKRWFTDTRPRDEAKGVETGWAVNDAPPGFQKVTELHRTMPGRAAPVSQLVFSDGVASISVFVEANTTPPRTAEASSEDGTTTFFVRPMGDTLVSVLGEVPLATAQQVARSVARRP